MECRCEQAVKLAGGEAKTVSFAPETYSQLKLEHPRLWWPYQMGKPNLYTAKLDFEVDGHASDAAEVTFGIREVTSELTDKGYRLFKINGRKVLIRGAAWAPDMFLRWSPERLDADLAYVRDMGLNTIRLEGRIDHEEFFRQDGQAGNSGDAGMDVLRRVGAMEALERRSAQSRGGFIAEPDPNFAQSSERVRLAERQRWSAAGRRGENVSGHSEGIGVAESFGIVGSAEGKRRLRESRA